MPDPATLSTMATVATIAGGAVSAVGAVQAGLSAANQADFQADVSQQQADREREASRQEAEDFRREQSRLQARRRAVMGGSGVQLATGSPLLASEDFASETELQAARLEAGGELRATRLDQEAELTRAGGRNARTGGFIRGGSLLVSSAGRLWRDGA